MIDQQQIGAGRCKRRTDFFELAATDEPTRVWHIPARSDGFNHNHIRGSRKLDALIECICGRQRRAGGGLPEVDVKNDRSAAGVRTIKEQMRSLSRNQPSNDRQ
jgi:hypothetical protein